MFEGVTAPIPGGKRPEQVEVFQSRSGLKVFEDAAIGDPVHAACGSVRVVDRVAGQSRFDADVTCDGLVVVGDPYYRGWRASVDGRRVPIQEYEGRIRAVRVEPGRHRIEFRYQPASLAIGAGLTLLGLSFAVGLRRFGV